MGMPRKGRHLWGGVQGHGGPNPARRLPVFLGTARFSKVSGIHAIGSSLP